MRISDWSSDVCSSDLGGNRPLWSPAMPSPETPILVLTTGGTIDKIYFDALSDYQVGETVVAKLLDIGRVKRPFRIEEVVRKDSLELDDADRALIRDRVAAPPASRTIIPHAPEPPPETANTPSPQ